MIVIRSKPRKAKTSPYIWRPWIGSIGRSIRTVTIHMVVPYVDIDICIVIDVYTISSISPISIGISVDIRISIIVSTPISRNVVHPISWLLP